LDLKHVVTDILSDPSAASQEVLDRVADLVQADLAAKKEFCPYQAARLVAWLPPRQSDYLFQQCIIRFNKLEDVGRLRLRKPVEAVFQTMIDQQRKLRLAKAAKLLAMLGVPDVAAEKVAEQKRIKEARYDRACLKKDRDTYSTTFSKSSSRIFVQGGAPGLKR
jgi:hypothetical protein